MTKKVILLTNKFPYGIVETFIEAELQMIPDNIELTIVPTQKHPESDKRRPVPENVKVDNFLNSGSKLEYFFKTILALFSKDYRNEIAMRKHGGKLTIADRIHIAGYFGRARQTADNVYRKYGDSLKLGNTTLYSYWLTEASYAEKLLKERTDCRCISRAHGTDVYDGHCVYGTIPGQSAIVDGIDKIYVCSRNGMEYLKRKYPNNRDKFSYSYLGTEDYGCKTIGSKSSKFVLASCSRLTPVKRVSLIAEALENITEYQIKWVHIGDGPERARTEAAIENLPKNINVELTGNLSHESVMQFYVENDVDLFVNVSESEGLPVSIMEVISFGIPVIATDVGGTSEIVQPNVGRLVEGDFTPQQLAELIRQYIDMDADDYASERAQVRSFWEEHFSAERNYNNFYNEITR